MVLQRKLRGYQWDAVLYLCGHARGGHRLLGLNAPTGSGKTLIVNTFLMKGGRALFRGAVVAAPTTETEANFYKDLDVRVEPKEARASTSVIRYKADKRDLYERPRGHDDSKVGTFKRVVEGDTSPDEPWVYLTTHNWLVRYGADHLPKDLTGILLVLDESHHAGSGDESEEENPFIGKLTEAWVERGGTVLLVTATPFRSDGKTVFPDGTKAFVWTIAQHAERGFAPNDFKIHTVPVEGVEEGTTADLAGTDLDEEAANVSFKAMAARWVADGRPKAVFIVPSRGADTWAARLGAELEAVQPGGRVVNAVGTTAAAKNELALALRGGKDAAGNVHLGEQNVRRYEDSKVAAIIACRRFDEGTDWPLCSHVYCYGIASSFGIIIQRWGRAFRNKRRLADEAGIEGYPAEHANRAHITFFIRKVKPDVLKQFEQQHHHHAFLLACYMADWETGRDIASQLRIRWERHWERRPTTAFERVDGEQAGAFHDGVHTAMLALLREFRLKYRVQTRGGLPTLAEEQAYVDSLDLTPEQRTAALRILFMRAAEHDPIVLDAYEEGLGLITEMNHAALQTVFRSVVDQYRGQTYADETDDKVIAFFSSFTGQDAASVAAGLAGNTDLDISDLDVVRRVLRPYIAKHKKMPDRLGGMQDVTNLVGGGVPTTLYDVDRMLRRRGLDLPRLVSCIGWVDGLPVDVPALRAKLGPHAQRLRNRVVEASSQQNWDTTGTIFKAQRNSRFDLSREFGVSENLVGLAMCARFGWRGLAKGTPLVEILWPPVQTPPEGP